MKSTESTMDVILNFLKQIKAQSFNWSQKYEKMWQMRQEKQTYTIVQNYDTPDTLS